MVKIAKIRDFWTFWPLNKFELRARTSRSCTCLLFLPHKYQVPLSMHLFYPLALLCMIHLDYVWESVYCCKGMMKKRNDISFLFILFYSFCNSLIECDCFTANAISLPIRLLEHTKYRYLKSHKSFVCKILDYFCILYTLVHKKCT